MIYLLRRDEEEDAEADRRDRRSLSFKPFSPQQQRLDSLVETSTDQNFGEQLCDCRWSYPIGKDDCLYYWLSNLVTGDVLW